MQEQISTATAGLLRPNIQVDISNILPNLQVDISELVPNLHVDCRHQWYLPARVSLNK